MHSLFIEIKENDQLTMAEKKKATDLILTFADIFATQAQDLESCTLEQLEINLVEGMDIPVLHRIADPLRMTNSLRK